jgi:hypothetical protein
MGDYSLSSWNFENDPSSQGLNNSTYTHAESIVLYNADGSILWGKEPDDAGTIVPELSDGITMLKILTGTSTTVDMAKMDMNKDAKLNLADVILVLKQFAE